MSARVSQADEKTLDSKVWLQCGPIPVSPDDMKMKSMIIVGIDLHSDFRGLLSVKACFESAAKAYLGVGGQGLCRHWWLGPVQELGAEACF